MKIKKLKILTLFLMAFFIFGCVDNQKEKTKPAPAPKPPVVEPTTPPATAPFTIKIANIKDYYGFGVIYSKIHLTDKDGNIIKTKVLDNFNNNRDNYITTAEFTNLAINNYKLCLQSYEIERQDENNIPNTEANVCDYWLTETNEKSANTNLTDDKNQAQIINTNLLANLVLPKNMSIIIKVSEQYKKEFIYFINGKTYTPVEYQGARDGNRYYLKNTLLNKKVSICFSDSGNQNPTYTCYKDYKTKTIKQLILLPTKTEEEFDKNKSENDKRRINFFENMPKFDLNNLKEINF